jgi:hypothetical protein
MHVVSNSGFSDDISVKMGLTTGGAPGVVMTIIANKVASTSLANMADFYLQNS